jgi:hypothetical protein
MITVTMRLAPKGPRVHGFKMTNSVDHIVKIIIQMRLNFTVLKSMKINAYVCQETDKFE